MFPLLLLLGALASPLLSGDLPPAYGKLPLSFAPSGAPGAFAVHGNGYAFSLTAQSAELRLASGTVRMALAGARPQARLEPLAPLPGVLNWFVGSDPARWRRGVPTYARLRAVAVLPGVDLVYYGNQQQLEYDLIVAPGANPAKIRWQFAAVDSLRLAEDGALLLATSQGELRWRAPEVYQEKGGRRLPVASAYTLHRGHRVGFRLGAYDKTLPLIIDPTFDYARHLTQPGRAYAVQVDRNGQTFFAGSTPEGPHGGENAFLAKLDNNGNVLLYFSVFGGSGDDRAHALILGQRSVQDVWITGRTSSPDFPVHNPTLTRHSGGTDAFLFHAGGWDGRFTMFGAYLGGSGNDSGNAIALNPTDGTLSVAGSTDSPDFPLADALQPVKGLGTDGFLTKFRLFEAPLLQSTYLGGDGADTIAALKFDAGGRAWLAGTSTSSNLFAAPATHQPRNAGGADCLVTGLNHTGAARVFSSYLGGAADDGCTGLGLTPGGNIVVSGYTDSANFPTLNPTQAAHGGARDMFVAEFGPVAGLQFSTFLGGPRLDTAHGLAVDDSGTIHLAGESTGQLPLLNPVVPEKAGSPGVLLRGATPGGALAPVPDSFAPETEITAWAFASAAEVFAAGGSGRLYRSLDGGSSWSTVAAPAGGIESLAISGTALLAANPRGAWLSLDRGATWRAVNTGLPADLSRSSVLINPETGAFYLAHPSAGFFRSLTNGVSWAAANAGLANRNTLHLAADPQNPALLYLATAGGLYRSGDGGGSWALAGGVRVLTHAVPTAETGTLYGVEAGRPVVSTDAARTWALRPLPWAGAVLRLAADPANPRHVLAATAATGIWRTLDSGLTWSLASLDDATALDVLFAPGGGPVLAALRNHPDAVVARWGQLQAGPNRYTYYLASVSYFGTHQADAGLAVTADENTINTYLAGYSAGSPFVTRFGPSPPACTYKTSADAFQLSPPEATATSFQMVAPSGCSWTAASGAPWLQLGGSANRTGSGEVRAFTLRNESPASRETTLTLGGISIAVRQNGTACESEARLTNTESYLFSYGGVVRPRLEIPAGCEWRASVQAPWITLSPLSGVGPSVFVMNVESNANPLPRSAAVRIGPAGFTLTQRGTCRAAIRPAEVLHAAGGASGVLQVEADAACPWTLSSSHPDLQFPAGATGAGPGAVRYTLAPNPGPESRIASINGLIGAGLVHQDGNACTYTVSPNPVLAPRDAGTIFPLVTTQPGCRRPAHTAEPWIRLTGVFGMGSGPLEIALERNPSIVQRTGLIEIGGQSVLVVQSGQYTAAPTIAPPNPASGSGATRLFTFDVSDLDGDLDVVNILISSSLDARGACYLAYVRSTNTLYLVPDSGEGLLTGELSNSQCAVDSQYRTLNGHGAGAVLALLLTFSPSFSGNKVVYLAARDRAGHNTGWLPLGAWNVPSTAVTVSNAPQVTGLSPGRVATAQTTLELTVSDPDGIANLNVLNLLINSSLDARDACYLAYVYPSNTLYLVPDSGEGLFPAGISENRQCRILPPGVTAIPDNGRLKLRVPIEFKSGPARHRILYGAAGDLQGNNSGWQAVGTVSVP